MPITRDPSNLYGTIEWTTEINGLDRQFDLTPAGLFTPYETTQTAIVFEKDLRTTTLLPSVSRGPRGSTYNQDRLFETFSLPLAYFKHSDYITPEDIQSVRMYGTPDGVERLDVARARKLEQMRRDYDQTMAYMQFRCMTEAKCLTPNQVLVADTFVEFGLTQTTVTWDITDANFDLGVAMRELKRKVRDGMQNGGIMSEPTVYLESSDFDAVITHANVKDAYKYFQATVNPQRDDIIDGFRHAGVTMLPIDGAFNLPDGNGGSTPEDIMTVGTGFGIPIGAGIFREYSGPSNKLSGANGGAIMDLYAYEYTDTKDEHIEMQIEAHKLYMCEKPAALIKINVVTS